MASCHRLTLVVSFNHSSVPLTCRAEALRAHTLISRTTASLGRCPYTLLLCWPMPQAQNLLLMHNQHAFHWPLVQPQSLLQAAHPPRAAPSFPLFATVSCLFASTMAAPCMHNRCCRESWIQIWTTMVSHSQLRLVLATNILIKPTPFGLIYNPTRH